MPKKPTRREVADDAFLRSQQIDLETQAIPPVPTPQRPYFQGVPNACPSCAVPMTLESGWTALSATTAGHGVLCCGQCGHSISVPTTVYDGFRAATRALADERAARLNTGKTRPEKRPRGAG